MQMKNIKLIIIIITVLAIAIPVINAQAPQKKVSEMTKDEIMELKYDDLLTLSFEDLILVANKFGLSADELLEYFLNKDVTSASKRAEKSLNSPLSSTVLSRDEIVKSGATNIPEALRLVPGMIVREKTDGNYDVHIRGNDNIPPKNMFVYSEDMLTLVMIDGRPVYNYSFGGTFRETLPVELNDIDRIEVIRGPSSALYGPNAVAGVINIITRKVKSNKPHVEANVQKGNFKATIADVSASIGLNKKFHVRVSGNYTRLNRFQDDYYVYDAGGFYSQKQIDSMRYWFLASKNPKNALAGVYLGRDTNLIAPLNENQLKDPTLGTEKSAINAFLDYTINKDIGFDLTLGAQQSNIITNSLGTNEFPECGRSSATKYIDFKSHVNGFQAQVNYMFGNQDVEKGVPGWHIDPAVLNASLEYERTLGTLTLRPGISYQQAIYDDSKYVKVSENQGFLNGSRELNSFSYYLRADYKAFDKLRLIAALRGDKYNYPDKNYITYQFISTYNINENNLVPRRIFACKPGPFYGRYLCRL